MYSPTLENFEVLIHIKIAILTAKIDTNCDIGRLEMSKVGIWTILEV